MEIPYGKNMGQGQDFWQNFQSNGLVPFNNFLEASEAKRQLENRQDIFLSVTIAEIRMELAENVTEFSFFKNKKNLIVVWKEELRNMILVGRFVEGRPGHYPLLGAKLEFNGMQPINSFDSAIRILREINRQAQSATSIATFALKRF